MVDGAQLSSGEVLLESLWRHLVTSPSERRCSERKLFCGFSSYEAARNFDRLEGTLQVAAWGLEALVVGARWVVGARVPLLAGPFQERSGRGSRDAWGGALVWSGLGRLLAEAMVILLLLL